MGKKIVGDWRFLWGTLFLLLAIGFNSLYYAVFADVDYLMKFILAQLGFLPISVFLVTVVLNQLLARRERQALLKKMNMVIGAFFSEVGNEMLVFLRLTSNSTLTTKSFLVQPAWQKRDYGSAEQLVRRHDFKASCTREEMVAFRDFLQKKRDFLLALLANPNLLEHDSFSEMLWAVLHLTEELTSRNNLANSSDSDVEHLIGDMERAFKVVLIEWLSYMRHLQDDYPYLFSLAVRVNPFAPDRRAEVD